MLSCELFCFSRCILNLDIISVPAAFLHVETCFLFSPMWSHGKLSIACQRQKECERTTSAQLNLVLIPEKLNASPWCDIIDQKIISQPFPRILNILFVA